MNFKAENTYDAKPIDLYEVLSGSILKIGKAKINIDFAKAVWEILSVDENSIVKDYIYQCKRDMAYSIYIESEKGCAIIPGII